MQRCLGLFPADFLWLTAWGDMQASHALRPQWLFPALRIPFCPLPLLQLSLGHASSPGEQLHSPSSIAPHCLCTHVRGAVRLGPGGWTSITRRVGGLNVKMPFLICLQLAWGLHSRARRASTVPRARHTWAWLGKPTKFSQVPALRDYFALHVCKAQQVWAGPDNGHSCSTDSELLIWTDACFSFFFYHWLGAGLVPTLHFHRSPGHAARGSASCWVRSCGLQGMRTKDRQKGSLAAPPSCQAPTARTQIPGAASDVDTHELRAVLWDKA